jgi:hypothetical protein
MSDGWLEEEVQGDIRLVDIEDSCWEITEESVLFSKPWARE